MLLELINTHRAEIIARCRSKIASRPAPRPTDAEMEFGVPLFLDQLAEVLHRTLSAHPEMVNTAKLHGNELSKMGFTVAQVVRDYGGVCQAITELAVETSADISAVEFQMLNLCLDNAIAEAVTEYVRLRDHSGTERLGFFAHEMRNFLASALLSVNALQSGTVGISGSTGAILSRSLAGLGRLIDRELADVRLGAGVMHRETIVVRDFVEDVEVPASLEANTLGLQLSVMSVNKDVLVHADRQILTSVVSNLLQNAFKFTKPNGHVLLRAHATSDRVLIDVEDECGGLPAGQAQELFRPFEQRGTDRTGLGLGLTICHRGALASDGDIHVRNHPGSGCVFTLNLPRAQPEA